MRGVNASPPVMLGNWENGIQVPKNPKARKGLISATQFFFPK